MARPILPYPSKAMLSVRMLVEIPFGLHQLRVEQGGARGAANGVVRKRRVLELEHRTGSHAANDRGHAALGLDVEPGLRPILLLADDDRVRGRGGQLALLRQGAIAPPGFDEV